MPQLFFSVKCLPTFTVSSKVAKLRKPGFRAPDNTRRKQNRKMAIQGHVFWGQWKGDKGLNNNNAGLIS